MSRRHDRELPECPLPPALVRLIHAARRASTIDASSDRHGEADLLAELGRLALVMVPATGALAPVDDHLYTAIGDAAERHLRLKRARRDWQAALNAVVDAEGRDALEGSHLWVLTEANKAYFYAGLASGIVLSDPGGFG